MRTGVRSGSAVIFVHMEREMMSDLISRKALCDDLREYKVHPVPVSSDESEVKGYNDGIDLAISVIAEFPSAEPEERTAKVIRHRYEFTVKDNFFHAIGGTELLCENCKKKVLVGDDYCSHCGAKLIWGEEK